MSKALHWHRYHCVICLSWLVVLTCTWLRADPYMTTAGLTDRGGTGSTVTIIQSGLANFGSIPSMKHSSSTMCFNISQTLSALSAIFFSWESSFACFHSAVTSSPVRRRFGWYLPQPPCPCLRAWTGKCVQLTSEWIKTQLGSMLIIKSNPLRSILLHYLLQSILFKFKLCFDFNCCQVQSVKYLAFFLQKYKS